MHGVVEYDVSSIRGALANAFIILINALFFNVKLIGLHDVYPRDYSEQLLNEVESAFDFIIVGAGAAGCSLANELTNQDKWTVLLLEAGDYPSTSTEVPGLYTTLIGSREDWNFRMEKDSRACNAFENKECIISKGKVLGGTSTINDLLYVRGLPEEYDQNHFDEWSSNITYTIFQTLENYNGYVESAYPYGTKGPIYLEHSNNNQSLRNLLEYTYNLAGCKRMPNRNSIGFMSHLMMVHNGERVNMAKAFLTPIKDRPNLFFSKNTEVEAIGITEPVDKRANGVNVSINGVKFFLRAKKEVILTAGAINNPKLLMLSGIGSKSYLTNKNIPVVMDMPGVGQNMQLHLTVPLFVAMEPCCSVCQKEYYYESDIIRDTFEYIMFRSGNWSHTGINNFVSYILTKKIGTTLPNLSIHHHYFKIGDKNLLTWIDAMRYHPKITKALLNHNKEKSLVMFLLTLIKPLSKGEVMLNDTHFLSNPIVRGNFLTDENGLDYETLLTGVDFIFNLTERMDKSKAEFLDVDVPDCRNFKFCTLRYVKCYIDNMAFPRSDVTGTIKMGPECDDRAVVKENLEVRKVRCLRVADSSTLNNIPRGSTVATDAMIGFKAGEIIKEKWIKDYVSPYEARKSKDDDE